MKKLIALVLILVATILIISLDDKSPYLIDDTDTSNPVYKYKKARDGNWEYVKDRLFDGKGNTEYVYKISPLSYVKNAPILINLYMATKQDSIVVNEIINELKELLPHKTIDFLENFTNGVTLDSLNHNSNNDDNKINGITYFNLRLSVIELNFHLFINSTVFDDKIRTTTFDGSIIERTNQARNDTSIKLPSKVWFNFYSEISKEKRKKYIRYEVLRTLCLIYPIQSNSRESYPVKGVFFTANYIPDVAEFNDKDKFLLQKLYTNDFSEQFKEYLYNAYSWQYASNFLNKNLTQIQAWAVIIIVGLLALVLLFSFFQNRKFKYSYFNYFLPILFIMLYVMTFIMVYIYMTNITNEIADQQPLILYVLLGVGLVAAVVASFLLWLSDKICAKLKGGFSFQLILKIIFTLLVFNSPFLVMMITEQISSDFLEFFIPMFIITVVLAFGRGLLIYLNHFSESLVKEKDVELSRLKEVNAQSELKLLQSHINPHFLYNALNSIAGLAHNDADKTEQMALSLSDLFRYSINKKGEKMSTVSEEVTMVQNYLDIEKIRFGKRLKVVLTIDDTIKEEKIPMFMLQPLVENAIKHGISKIGGEGKISLEIKKVQQELLITVSDNGPDFPKGLVSGHGLQTVYDLLRLSYGEDASLSWENTPTKQITISIKKN